MTTSNPSLPRLSLWLREIACFPARFNTQTDLQLARGRDGQGRPVLVIPGFLASDFLTTRLRGTLDAAGYRAAGWEFGTNFGARANLLDQLAVRFDAVCGDAPQASIIGWSLGGIYARELAKRRPDRIDRVVTLGTPFSGSPRANRAWRLYEFINRHPVDAPPLPIARTEKPPAPTFALWSPEDGIVAAESARGRPGEADRTIEVPCRHMGFISQRVALRAILDVLETPLPLPDAACAAEAAAACAAG